MPTRLIDRSAGWLATRTSRRGFLGRAAIAGSALAVAPTTWVLRPVSAYATICNCSGSSCDCGAQCCDGYTEFCCTITGQNACPPGTALGGWWKADGSGFCGNGSRYYLDCNVVPPSNPCSCGCANGSCGNRKACCTQFRYGQCHQEIPVMGAIMCRVVTCTPPWELDPTCTQTVLTDNNTRFHDALCLHGIPFGSLDQATAIAGGIFVSGWALDPDTTASTYVWIDISGHGFPLGTPFPRPDIAVAYPGYGPNHGYQAAVPAAPGTYQVCATAINTGSGPNNPLGCRTVTVPISGIPFGSLDQATAIPGGIFVSGWALDPDTAASTYVWIDISGHGFPLGTPFPRPDIAAAYPGYGPNHGYQAAVPAAPGTYQVCATAINTGSGVNNPLGCRTVTVV